MVGRSQPTMVGDHLYAADESGTLYVLDPKTGESVSSRRLKMLGSIVRASPLYADGKVYMCSTSAWHIFEPTKDGAKIIHRMRFPIGVEECYASPIVSHGKLYLTTTAAIYCLAKPNTKTGVTPRPEPAKEAPVGPDTKVAHVQVVPAELLLKPGEKQQYEVRVYNGRGQRLELKSKPKFAVDAHGEIDPMGNFMADSSAGHVAATVSATVDGQSGFARVRIVPPLPWKFDFNDGQVPITWVGARYRHVVREINGEKLLVKRNDIPLGTRSQSWMGHTDLHDYTIQADVYGNIKNNKMPDIGLIAQRYTLDLMGVNKQFQIRSWTAQLEHRFAATKNPHEWKQHVWYTMKFRAAVEDGKAVLRGKVWERGKPEPAEWTISGTDAVPNVVGSPGLFGNANDAEIYYDNITVTPNTGAVASK
jgi:hypothetical protein